VDRSVSSDELFVVPAERHVERLAREGRRAETLSSLRARLVAALLPDVRFADARETKLTLAVALEEAKARGAQLELFGPAPGAGADAADPLLVTLRGRGGASWVRAVAAIDDAIGALRSRGATEAHLERVRGAGVAPARARTLAAAMRALDAALARAGARDGRLVGATLAPAIQEAGPAAVAEIVGALHLRARWLIAWDPQDLAWWRALDETLARAGGDARVVLPAFDKRLEGSRERDPLEVVADVVARHLDAAPETEIIPAVLGDLVLSAPSALAPDAACRVRLARAANARDEARLGARTVRRALDAREARVERVAIAYPARDERTLVPLRRALLDEGVVFHDAAAAPPAAAPVVAAALQALDAAESLDRVAVARLLRSGYVDAPRVLRGADARDAERLLARVARALETRATAAAEDAVARLVLTASGGEREGAEASAATVIVEVLARARAARARVGRVRAARGLFHELGLGARAGRGALGAFARDDAPSGVDGAERVALARDVRAWEALEEALDVYEQVAQRTGAADRALDAGVFRLELADLLDRPMRLPSASRAGAVRVVPLSDLPGDELDLLVVLDANDGLLPRDTPPISLLSDTVESAVARAARGAFASRQQSELAARDLAALAVCAAEAARIVIVTTAEQGAEAPASPSRVFVALERAGAEVISIPEDEPPSQIESALRVPSEIARRAARERAREAFFLDPARPESDLVGTLAPSPAIVAVVAPELGADERRPVAVTAIERFAQCPFKGYAHVVLAAREPEEQRELPDAREEGNLAHAALAAAFAATREAWARRPREAAEILERGLVAADEVLNASPGHAALRAVVRFRVRESVRAVLTRAIEDERWDFILAEQPFGSRSKRAGESWPAFDVGGELWLRGSIDRVDRAHGTNDVRVLDYKRSKNTVREASSQLGVTALQVPIYAAVAARQLGAPATGTYMPIQPRDLATETKARVSVEERVTELARRPLGGLSEIEKRVLELVSAARAGRFAPVPARESECTHCGVSGGCRKPRFAMAPGDEAGEEKDP
jgi:hypothetical protein